MAQPKLKREGEMLAITFTLDRPVQLDDVAKCGRALQRLLNALWREVTGKKRGTFPMKVTNMKFIDDGKNTLTFRILWPQAAEVKP